MFDSSDGLASTMRAELPLSIAGRTGRRRLSGAGWRALASDLVRVADIAAIALAGIVVAATVGTDVPDPAGAMLLIGCLLAANILPFMQAYRTDHLRHPSSGIPRV